MIWFFTPYSFEKKLLEAYDRYMSLIPSDDDWVCLMDGDTAFLRSDFGVAIKDYISASPDAGMFTCYASRCHYQVQTRRGTEMDNPSLAYHKRQADKIYKELHPQVKTVNRRIAGHLMVIRKGVWLEIRDKVFKTAADKNILGVDTKISRAILETGRDILLMRGIYILHYLRLNEGFNSKEHLL